MSKPTIEQVFHDATEPGPRWTNRQVALFHAFNPHGLVAAKRANDDQISRLVDEGRIKSGATIAYGGFQSFEVDVLMRLANHRFVNGDRLASALRMLRRHVEEVRQYIAQHQ